MLAPSKINEIAKDVAVANLGADNVVRVSSESIADSDGEDALRITIIIPENAIARISGDNALKTLVRMQERLRSAGDERFAIVEYATQRELDEVDDTES